MCPLDFWKIPPKELCLSSKIEDRQTDKEIVKIKTSEFQKIELKSPKCSSFSLVSEALKKEKGVLL